MKAFSNKRFVLQVMLLLLIIVVSSCSERKDKRWFYSGQAAYSFKKLDYVLWEFPKHYLAFKYQYDVMNPMDKFLDTDKDNVFVGMKWTKVD